MKLREIAVGGMSIVVALTLSACLVAVGTQTSGAYFTDTKSGGMTGTYAVPEPPAPTVPFLLEAGVSKALHEAQGNDHSGKELPIAQRDASGALRLDFGDAPAGHGDTRPDVFRIVSLIKDSRAVSFRVTGPMADFVTEVSLDDGHTCVLKGRSTERVRITIRVPDRAAPGTYTGTLSVHVQGWADDARLPMTFTVTGDKGKDGSGCGDGNRGDGSHGGSHGQGDSSIELSDLTDTQPDASQTTTETATPDPAQDPAPSQPSTTTPEPTSTPGPIDEEGTHDDGY